jgi:hypothetical protein
MLAGGALPPKVYVTLPAEARNSTDAYKDYRSYTVYSCVPPGSYFLSLYDSFGDGWAGATIVLTQLTNGDASKGCELLKGSLAGYSKNYTFAVQVRTAPSLSIVVYALSETSLASLHAFHCLTDSASGLCTHFANHHDIMGQALRQFAQHQSSFVSLWMLW